MASVMDERAGLQYRWVQVGSGNYMARPKDSGFTLVVDRVGHNNWRWWIERAQGLAHRADGKAVTAVKAKVECEERFREVFVAQAAEAREGKVWRQVLEGSGLGRAEGAASQVAAR